MAGLSARVASRPAACMAAAFVAGVALMGAVAYLAYDELADVYRWAKGHYYEPPAIAGGAGGAAPGVLEWLPGHYAEEAGDLLSLSYDRHVEVPGDFEAWAGQVREVHGLGRFDISKGAAGFPEPSLERSEDRGGHVLEKYSAAAPDGDTILFWRLVPEDPARCAVLVVPGSGHQGARDVAGVESDASRWYYQEDVGVRLAEGTGCPVYVPELRGYGEREHRSLYCDTFATGKDATRCSHSILERSLAAVGLSLPNKSLLDLAQVLSYAAAEGGPLAVGGLSLGSHYGSLLAAANAEAVDAAFLASGPLAYGLLPPSLEGGVPLVHTDATDVVTLLAPGPLYVSYGTGEMFHWRMEAETGVTGEVLRERWAGMGGAGNLTYVAHGGGHGYDVGSLVEFVSEALRPGGANR